MHCHHAQLVPVLVDLQVETKRRALHGVTITELLAWMTVISVIAAISFAGLTSSRQSAVEASHISNLRQLGLAWSLYASDNSERYPLVSTLVISNAVPIELLKSDCDNFPLGWANQSDRFFEEKISVIDTVSISSKISDGIDVVEHGKLKGWALIPGCNAKKLFTDTRDAFFVGRFKRLNSDGSVVSRLIPSDQTWISVSLLFDDDYRNWRGSP